MARRKKEAFEIKPFPVLRQATVDVLAASSQKHMIHGLVEFNVTEPLRLIRAHEAYSGEKLSFTAFVIGCLGKAVDMNRHMHAYRDWRNRLVLFEEVDVSTIIEREAEGHKTTVPLIIRGVNKQTLRQIHTEIRAAQTKAVEQVGVMRLMRFYLLLPGFLRPRFWGVLRKFPQLMKTNGGTVLVTAIGMFGEGGGWGIPVASHTLNVTLGGISEKPGVVDGRIEICKYLSLTLSFDHDIIDGAPAARFTQRFKDLVESGYGLADPR